MRPLLHPTVRRRIVLQPRVRHFRSQPRLYGPRPLIPFLSPPRSVERTVRYFSAERKKWLRHEAKIFVRFNLTVWGIAVSAFAIWYMVSQEMLEREYPTPLEWGYLARKSLRDARKWMDGSQTGVDWVRTLTFARASLARLESPKIARKQDVDHLVKLGEVNDPMQELEDEFTPRDISAKSEEWRRGYCEALMLSAQAAEQVDGWLMHREKKAVCPPQHVVGPSNPKPKPLPPGSPPPFREEDCQIAFPTADRWYIKALATEGFAPRQRMEIGIAYGLFMDFKNRPEEAQAMYHYALSQATIGLDASSLSYDPKTFAVKENTLQPPSENVFAALTAIANHRARNGQISPALAMYISLLKARRSLSNLPPKPTPNMKPKLPLYRQILQFISQPEYPPPPLSGDAPPWRSPSERCQEASLNIYIGEILYATKPSSREDGLAWTREGVDLAEEELRPLVEKAHPTKQEIAVKKVCRECLRTGLDNWGTMVRRLSREEREMASSRPQGGFLSFWSDSKKNDGRWEAEEAVIKNRVKRTKDLVEDLRSPKEGIDRFFKA